MNCYNHPSEIAVAQCAHCGKGLCRQCVKGVQPITCASCFYAQKRKFIWECVMYLGFYILFFIIGYSLNFLTIGKTDVSPVVSGLILSALVSGRQFIKNQGLRMIKIYSTVGLVIEIVLKIMIYTFVGLVTLPYNIIKTIINLIDALKK